MDTRVSCRLPPHVTPLVVAVVLGLLAFVPVLGESPLRPLLVLPLVLFAPGYALVAATFPAGGGDARPPVSERTRGGLRPAERLLLSFLTTLLVVTAVAVGLNAAGRRLSFTPMVLVLLVVTLGAGAVATLRSESRSWISDPHASPPRSTRIQGWFRTGRDRLTADGGPPLFALVIVALAVLFAVGSLGFAATATGGESTTALYLLTETGDGTTTLDDYPTSLDAGEEPSLVVGIDNPGDEPRTYSVVVLVQRVAFEDGSARVVEQRELDRFRTRLGAGETWHHPHRVALETSGERLRLTYLLYRGVAPEDPASADALRETYLWVDTTGTESTATRVSGRWGPDAPSTDRDGGSRGNGN